LLQYITETVPEVLKIAYIGWVEMGNGTFLDLDPKEYLPIAKHAYAHFLETDVVGAVLARGTNVLEEVVSRWLVR
jgi:L-asparaginase/Glu-tRNA(Gln) amidotransferase subunit D